MTVSAMALLSRLTRKGFDQDYQAPMADLESIPSGAACADLPVRRRR